jgi:hypothetical protein
MSTGNNRPFDVVAMVTSAGGLSALMTIIPKLPHDFRPESSSHNISHIPTATSRNRWRAEASFPSTGRKMAVSSDAARC